MQIELGTGGSYDEAGPQKMTGNAWIRTTVTAPDGTNVYIVSFSPDARTHWHRHPGGQFLYCISGRGKVRSKDQTGHILTAGDVVYVDANEWHYHGADHGSPMVHVAVNGGGDPEWGEPVTDEEYAVD